MITKIFTRDASCSTPQSRHCHIYLRSKVQLQLEPSKSEIEKILNCPVLHIRHVQATPYCAFTLKIHNNTLMNVLQFQSPELPLGCQCGKTWPQSSVHPPCLPLVLPPPRHPLQTFLHLLLLHGTAEAYPIVLNIYIKHLMCEGSDIITLSEHWLLPLEMHKLHELHDDYNAAGVSDQRLNAESNLIRGCGGVGII